MPSPDKEGRSGRLLAALRPSRAGAAFPVQTGFPTSLADLFVKNRGRLKKQPSPSSKRRKAGAGAPASPSPSLSPSSPPPPSPPPPPDAVSRLDSDRPRPDDISPAQAVRSGAFGLGLGFLAVSGAVSLALLVIWSRKVVAAVTVAAFSLFLLESLRSSLLPRRPRPAATEGRLYSDGRGLVSPIREVGAETEPSDSDGGTGFEAAEVDRGVLDYESSGSGAKAGKMSSWKKLIAGAKKLHRVRKSKDAEDGRSVSFRRESDRADGTLRGDDANATDSSGSRRGLASGTDSSGSRRSSEEILINPMGVDAPADLTNEAAEEEPGKSGLRFRALVLVAVVLVGLVAGKLPAVALTMLCAVFFSSLRRFPR